jgi:general secretion pathway protein I
MRKPRPSPRAARRVRGGRAAGFTLVEILVAFAVASLLLGVLYEIFSTGVRSGGAAEDYGAAVRIAESGLELAAATGEPSSIGSAETLDGKFERRIVVRPRPDLLPVPAAGPTSVPANAGPALYPYEVEVMVAWRTGRQERSITLSAVRLGPPP